MLIKLLYSVEFPGLEAQGNLQIVLNLNIIGTESPSLSSVTHQDTFLVSQLDQDWCLNFLNPESTVLEPFNHS